MKIAGGKRWLAGGFAAAVIALASAIGMHYEGVRYTAYQDTGGVWTICYGHTAGVQAGDTATPAQCKAWLASDYRTAYAVVDRCITAPLTVGQAAAFVDAAYNIGPAVVCGSTLQRLANSGHADQACKQLLRWDHAGGVRLRGLTLRRDDESALCSSQ